MVIQNQGPDMGSPSSTDPDDTGGVASALPALKESSYYALFEDFHTKIHRLNSDYTFNIYLWKFEEQISEIELAPVHLVTGSAGCQEGRDHFRRNSFEWSAFRSQDYGYTRFKAYNKTHINLEQVSVDFDGLVIDAFWIVKYNVSHSNIKS